MIKLIIGESAEIGDFLGISKRGNLRRLRDSDKVPCGIAITPLKRGQVAVCENNWAWRQFFPPKI